MKIDINKFGEVDLRVGKILSAEKVANADRLLHLQIDIGEENPRSIVSGIAEYFEPEDLVGKKCVVVANLEPRELKGIKSDGMLLGSIEGEDFCLLNSDAEVGSRIS